MDRCMYIFLAHQSLELEYIRMIEWGLFKAWKPMDLIIKSEGDQRIWWGLFQIAPFENARWTAVPSPLAAGPNQIHARHNCDSWLWHTTSVQWQFEQVWHICLYWTNKRCMIVHVCMYKSWFLLRIIYIYLHRQESRLTRATNSMCCWWNWSSTNSRMMSYCLTYAICTFCNRTSDTFWSLNGRNWPGALNSKSIIYT